MPSSQLAQPVRVTELDPSDLHLLKDLASFFQSVDFHGSQCEALLLTRASQSSLTASEPDSAGVDDVEADSIAPTTTASPTGPQPSLLPNLPVPDGTRPGRPPRRGRKSHGGKTLEFQTDKAFSYATIEGCNIIHRSFSNNAGCWNTTSTTKTVGFADHDALGVPFQVFNQYYYDSD